MVTKLFRLLIVKYFEMIIKVSVIEKKDKKHFVLCNLQIFKTLRRVIKFLETLFQKHLKNKNSFKNLLKIFFSFIYLLSNINH